MKIYGIYDITDNEQCIKIGTLEEIAKFFKLSARSINNALRSGQLWNRYELVYLFKE